MKSLVDLFDLDFSNLTASQYTVGGIHKRTHKKTNKNKKRARKTASISKRKNRRIKK